MRVLFIMLLACVCAPTAAAARRVETNAPAASFRAVYALTSDQSAKPDAVAAIVHEIKVTSGWYAGQTNGRSPAWLRDAGGEPLVATVRIAATAADVAAAADPLGFVQRQVLAAAPLAAATEKTVVWIDAATSNRACGISYFGDASFSVLFEAACGIYPSQTSYWPYGATYLQVHEMTHGFGAVLRCAPHYDGTGHVNDDPRDVLYSGTQPRDWQHLMLDPGHDDYYGTGRSDCPDIAVSTFWAPAVVDTLDVAVAGPGSVDTGRGAPCTAHCTVDGYEGTTVVLRADPKQGARFVAWTGTACTSQAPTCTTTLDRNSTATATFAAQPVSVSVVRAGRGTGTVTSAPAGIECGAVCAATFDAGTVITLTATPTAGSTFVGWNGDCAGADACTITATRATSVTAEFEALCVVPDVVGQPLASAVGAVGRASCRAHVTSAYSKSVPAGVVVGQNPGAGTTSPSGSPVELVVSRGPRPKPKPKPKKR